MTTHTVQKLDHSQSIAQMAEARRHAPGGTHSSIRTIDFDIVLDRAEGAYMWDVDGNRYVDYHGAFAAVFLGHAHPRVNRAVAEAVDRLDLVGLGTTESEMEATKHIVDHLPSADMALFCNTGSEATYHSIRLSRAITGRDNLVKFEGCYHGWHDYVLMNVFTPADKIETKFPLSAGMLPEALDHTTVLPFNDVEAVNAALSTKQYAAVILEPIAHNVGCIMPTEEFLRGLRELCTETGTILIFDEVITGFRHGLGGYQEKAALMPDLTTLGKAMTNGYPGAAIAGRGDLMEAFKTAGGPVHFSGTNNGHPVGTAATRATIAELSDGSVYEHVFRLGDRMRDGLQETASRLGVPLLVTGYGSIFVPYFFDPELGPPRNYADLMQSDMEKDRAFRRAMVERGIFVFPNTLRRMCISAAHTDEDIDHTLEVAEEVLRELR